MKPTDWAERELSGLLQLIVLLVQLQSKLEEINAGLVGRILEISDADS